MKLKRKWLIPILSAAAILALIIVSIPRARSYRSHSSLPVGECTWYAYEKASSNGWRIQFDVNWGRHARNWWEKVQNAERSDTPQPGAIMVLDAWKGNPYGHVAYVEQVESTQEWRITHANMSVGAPDGELGGIPYFSAVCERSPHGIRFKGVRGEFRLRGFLVLSHRS